MIYYTGDIHGDPYEVIQFCDSKKLTEQDTLVLLGDVGANYYRNRRDTEMKKVLTAVTSSLWGIKISLGQSKILCKLHLGCE